MVENRTAGWPIAADGLFEVELNDRPVDQRKQARPIDRTHPSQKMFDGLVDPTARPTDRLTDGQTARSSSRQTDTKIHRHTRQPARHRDGQAA